jgi:hypothetical protein
MKNKVVQTEEINDTELTFPRGLRQAFPKERDPQLTITPQTIGLWDLLVCVICVLVWGLIVFIGVRK